MTIALISSEKRIKMKKDHDPVERLAFHLIVYRDDAVEIAKNGLRCDQLGLPIKKYLGENDLNRTQSIGVFEQAIQKTACRYSNDRMFF